MSIYIGRQEEVAVVKETVRGTAATPARKIKQTDFDFDDKIESITDEVGQGVIEDADDNDIVKTWSEGGLGSKVLDITFGDILLAAFSTVVNGTATGETIVYHHDYSIAQSATHQSFTIICKNPNQQLAFPNAVLQSLELNFKLGDYVRFNTSWIGKTGVANVASLPAVTENHFVAKHASVKLATNYAGLDAASAINVSDLTLKMSYDIQSDDILGSVQPADYYNKQLSIEGTVELNYTDTTYRTATFASTAKAMRITVENTDVTIGSTSHPKFVINLFKLKFTEFAKDGGLNDIKKQKLSFKGFYSIADSKSITAKLYNTQATY